MKTKIIGLIILIFVGHFSFATDNLKLTPYGRIKATGIYASDPLNSFSFINFSAPTSAAHTESLPTEVEDAWSFQVAQSRLGLNIEYGQVFGNFETDFIDFSVASPTTEAHPRLRRAFVGYKLSENHEVLAGQDWDTFSPMNPNLLDYVGLYFNSGNVGFMREQMKWRYKNGGIQSELSVGLSGKNPTSEINSIETTKVPAVAYAFSYNEIGLSGIYSAKKQNNTNTLDIWGLNAFFKKDIAKFKLTSEVYMGQNMNEGGLLGISHMLPTGSQREAGGYLSLSYKSDQLGEWTLNYGLAQILNTENIGNYTYDSVAKKVTEDGILKNEVCRLYWNYLIKNGFSVVSELSYFRTERNLAGGSVIDNSFSLEAGLMLIF